MTMAKVAVPGSLTSNSLPFGRGSKVQAGKAMKRKTPSELRGEQLKRSCSQELVDESPVSLPGAEKNNTGVANNVKKSETSKVPRYIDTRVDEVFPVRKSNNRVRLLNGKEKGKDSFSNEQSNSLKKSTASFGLADKSQPLFTCGGSSVCSVDSTASAKDILGEACQTTETCNQRLTEKSNQFLSPSEASLGIGKSDLIAVDMDKVLKGLVAHNPPADSSEKVGDLSSVYSGSFCSEVHIPGSKTPLDLTLKTTVRLVSSSPVNWCHRVTPGSSYNLMAQFTSRFGCSGDHDVRQSLETAQALYSKALHSWVYPQSSLPPLIISALTSAAAQGGEADFLLKRQLAWEDSFQSLYYMLRRRICDIFYVCTSQFVVMFTGADYPGRTNRLCNAYISQSTRGLRSLLREHDICFSMPLCRSEVEQANVEDLVELSEIEKRNVGQARRLVSISDVDNSPQSLLAFSGNDNVHGLYDFLLNYRSILSSLTGLDVPLLYSPVPFQNASLCSPEVRCREMKRVDTVSCRGSNMEEGNFCQDSRTGFCYSIEVKDTFLPPWIISGICAAMGSEGRSFEASFTTEAISIGLNVALDTDCQKTDTKTEACKSLPESNTFNVPKAVVAPCLQSASLRGLKYCNGSYTASLLPL
ncbi:PREDICTED: protein downstream neighbor of Son [Nelumbo nucifera]|uniref:Protein downstream neighbor of Son n=2 Tax=Nelumbo nucifera TaxID=4432 RepID=A0A1U8AKJ3_NELNU|nr:PREDICTED: protein downstream neighbor of Son [Nelumbo nucifera]DAD29041.1 TPA_asm: hypothetical protein HUJ06_030509 [Nelumbo nucifera]